LKASSLSFWKWKLSVDERAGIAASQPSVHEVRKQRSASPSTTRAPKPGFVELSAAVVSTPAMLEVVLGDGLSVRVPTGFDETTLTRIVRAVGAAQ
jgi:hypothetical protein